MKKRIAKKQFNVRLPLHHIALIDKACDVLELDQVDVVREAIEMYTRRKKITLEGQVS